MCYVHTSTIGTLGACGSVNTHVYVLPTIGKLYVCHIFSSSGTIGTLGECGTVNTHVLPTIDELYVCHTYTGTIDTLCI